MKNTKKRKTVNKRDIIDAVRARGFSARKSAKAVDAVIDAWKFALWCGEEVEVPGGTLRAKITQGTEWATVQHFQNIATKEPMIRTVHTPGRRRVVKLKPDPALILTPDPPAPPPPRPIPPPPQPETDEESEERRLASALLGQAADQTTMAALRRAVEAHPRLPGVKMSPKPGALRRRLREMKARGWRFSLVSELAQSVSEYHWL